MNSKDNSELSDFERQPIISTLDPFTPLTPHQNKDNSKPKSILITLLTKLGLDNPEILLLKTEYCKHDFGCLENIISGTLNSLILSYVLNVGLNFLTLVPLKKKYGEFLLSLVKLDSMRLCGFITSYTFLLKTTLCLMRILRKKNDQLNNFMAGAVAGYFSIGFLEKTSRMTWSGYLLARAFDAVYRHLVNKKVFKKKEWHYLLIFSLIYGFYGHCIGIEPMVLPASIRKFLVQCYKSTYAPNRFSANNVVEKLLNEELERKYGTYN